MPLTESRLTEIASQLARRPGHEDVRVSVQMLLVDGLNASVSAVAHEQRMIEARGRIDALLGRTLFEFKSNLTQERRDVAEKLPGYLRDREAATAWTGRLMS